MESDGLVEDTVQIKDQPESSLERLRFDLSTVSEDTTLSNIPLSEIYGLDVNEDVVLNELYKSHITKKTIQDKDIDDMADSILSKMWNCQDSISFATSLRTHGQNFRRIAARSIGERDPTDVRGVRECHLFMFLCYVTQITRISLENQRLNFMTNTRYAPSWHNFSTCSRRVGPMQFGQESVRD